MSAATIRDAGPDDADSLAALEAEVMGVDAWSAALVRDGVSGTVPHARYLVGEADGRPVGYAVVSVVADISELQRIGVTGPARRRGIASALLEEAVARSRAGGADRLLLEVRETNSAALAFYAARGFVEVDRRPRYYRDGSTAVVMRRQLGGCG